MALDLPSAITIVGGVYLHFSDYFDLRVDKQINSKLKESVEKIDTKVQTTNDKLETLGQWVAKIEGKLDVLKIQTLAMQPKKRMNAKQASEILNTAKKEGTILDPKVITVAGQEFITAGVSSSEPDVWNAGLAFLNYRSTQNSVLAPSTDKFTPDDKAKHRWSAIFPIGVGAKITFMHGKSVPAEKAAVFEPIDKRLNTGEKIGSEFILLSGPTGRDGRWKLDGYRLRNVIFKDSEIAYEGGPADMQSVYFVNCTFNVAKKPNGKNFATSVLASAPATTFQAEG